LANFLSISPSQT
jgi:hypothetical protein